MTQKVAGAGLEIVKSPPCLKLQAAETYSRNLAFEPMPTLEASALQPETAYEQARRFAIERMQVRAQTLAQIGFGLISLPPKDR